uniref:Uncharacterized protein n=1 Tax=Rhizophora mucronata TaxID=61149 RepID=A0A2P2MK54_RHIMU
MSITYNGQVFWYCFPPLFLLMNGSLNYFESIKESLVLITFFISVNLNDGDGL